MEIFTSQAIYLGAYALGENKQRLVLFSHERGIVSGVYRPRQGRSLQMGTVVEMQWRARLAGQLGTIQLEPLPQQILDPFALKALAMQALMSMASLLVAGLPEKIPEKNFYKQTLNLLEALRQPTWWRDYVAWELGLLEVLGIGFELSRCAAGGEGNLQYLSPKSGCAVSAEAGALYADRLWLLPACFISPERIHPPSDYAHALSLIAQFIQRHGPENLAQLSDIRQNLAVKLAEMA